MSEAQISSEVNKVSGNRVSIFTGSRNSRATIFAMSAKFTNSFEFEQMLWRSGIARVAGVDEAGRGPLKSRFAFLPPENYGQWHERY